MHMLKKQFACFLAALIVLQIFVFTIQAAPSSAELKLNSEAALLIDAENETVLYEKNAHKKMAPASLTKLMILLLAMEDLEAGRVDQDSTVTISERAWRTGADESQMFLNAGQRVSFKELIDGIAVVSANDACIAVAEHLNGSVEVFVQRMNSRAAELGLKNSHFANVHGLDDPAHHMSAADVAHLTSYLIRSHPEALAISSKKELTFNEILQFNYNTLLGKYPGTDGMKTGNTPKAGYCLASTAEQQGMRLIGVTMHADTKGKRHNDSVALLDYGFCNYELKTLYEEGKVVTTIPVKRGQKKEAALVSPDPVRAVVPRNNQGYKITEELDLPRSLNAPVEKGDVVGTLRLKDAQGKTITEVELKAKESLSRLGFFPHIWRQAGDLFSGLWKRIRR